MEEDTALDENMKPTRQAIETARYFGGGYKAAAPDLEAKVEEFYSTRLPPGKGNWVAVDRDEIRTAFAKVALAFYLEGLRLHPVGHPSVLPELRRLAGEE